MFLPAFRVPTIEELREARRKRILIKMMAVYGDDSTDGDKVRVYAFGGVAGTQEEWDELEIKWLDRTGGIPFHATDCEAGQKSYKDMSEEKRGRLHRDLARILANSKLFGYGVAIDLKAFRKCFAATTKDDAYFYCFLPVVVHFFNHSQNLMPPQRVQFTFDLNPNVKWGNPSLLYEQYLTRLKEYEPMQQFINKDIAFGSKDSVGIQVSDLFTYEIMKNFQNSLNREVGTRTQKEILDVTKRFIIEKPRDEHYWREFSLKQHDFLKKSAEKYDQWRKENNIKTDNPQAQIRWMVYTDTLNQLTSKPNQKKQKGRRLTDRHV
jgi:hypothetical protein